MEARAAVLKNLASLARAPDALPVLEQLPTPPQPALPVVAPGFLARRVEARLALSSYRKDSEGFNDIRRVLSMPIEAPLTLDEADWVSRENVQAEEYERGFRLFPPQSAGLLMYLRYDGAFCPIPVGWGKTLLALLIAEHGFRSGMRRVMIVVPAAVYGQLVEHDIPWARRNARLTVPFILIGGRGQADRAYLSRSGRVGCYVMPSSLFSTVDTRNRTTAQVVIDGVVREAKVEQGVLDACQPELVIVDEAHDFKNRRTARTRRLMDYISEHKPRFVCMSGTMTKKRIKDYHHLIVAALGNGAPVPLAPHTADEWGLVVDADAAPGEGMMRPLRPLVDWAREHFPGETFPNDVSGFRKAYRLRLVTAPGVVPAGEHEIGTSLTMQNRGVENFERCEGWPRLAQLLHDAEELWLTPNGDELAHKIHVYKWMWELSAGFYNELSWPSAQTLGERHNLTPQIAEALLEKGMDHLAAKRRYNKALRDWIKGKARDGLDTPMLIGGSMERYGARQVGPELYEVWQEMRLAKDAAIPPWQSHIDPKRQKALERDAVAKRVCSYKIDAALRWGIEVAGDDEGGLCWYDNIEVGLWLVETMQRAGLDVLHCPAGARANEEIRDAKNAKRIVCASIDAHHKGKNLQHFGSSYVVQWPRQADIAEQMIGRTHRNGQERDHLDVRRADTIDFDFLLFAACLNDSLYIHQSTGSRQKLIYCGYDPMPSVFPSEVLRERGFENVILDAEQRRLLDDRFKGGAT